MDAEDSFKLEAWKFTALGKHRRSVKDSYKLLCGGVAEALKILGLNPRVNRGNITVRGRKISGSAQHRLYEAILHHGTFMVRVNMDTLEKGCFSLQP